MKLIDLTQDFIEFDKIKLSYFTSKNYSGIPVILLPGSYCDVKQYEKMISYFDDTFYIIIAEYRGHGGSWPPFKHGSIPKLAIDVKKIVNKLDLKKFFIVGHSIGGMVAIQMADTCNEDVLGIISIEGWTNHHAQKDAYGRNKNNTLTDEQLNIRQRERERVIKNWSKKQFKHFGNIWKKWDGYEILKNTEIPILELYGDRGSITPNRDQLHIPNNPKIELKILKNASHSVTLQFSNVLADEIKKFIEKIVSKQ